MKCAACKYNDLEGAYAFKIIEGLFACKGVKINLYACPICGTVIILLQ